MGLLALKGGKSLGKYRDRRRKDDPDFGPIAGRREHGE